MDVRGRNMTYLIFMNYIMLVGLYERMNIIENHELRIVLEFMGVMALLIHYLLKTIEKIKNETIQMR